MSNKYIYQANKNLLYSLITKFLNCRSFKFWNPEQEKSSG